MEHKMKKKALLLGPTGLIGGELLKLLLASDQYDQVICLSRRPLGSDHKKLQQHVLDFSRMGEYGDLFKVDDIFSMLGSTIKKAKTREAYKFIDYDLPLQAARLGKEKGASRFFIVSSIGAKANSPIFMLRLKGELERELLKLWPHGLFIFRPSFLLGERPEARPLEEISGVVGKCLSHLLIGPLKKFRKYGPIEGRSVARAIMRATSMEGGQHIIDDLST